MNIKRIEEIHKETAYPDSISVQQALLKVWNECEQEAVVKNNAVLRSVVPSLHTFKERRDKIGLTLRQVAKITKVSAATISRIERGEGECSYHNVAKLDDFYCSNGA
jgi:DNA-binding XRE family transcriptional regulator